MRNRPARISALGDGSELMAAASEASNHRMPIELRCPRFPAGNSIVRLNDCCSISVYTDVVTNCYGSTRQNGAGGQAEEDTDRSDLIQRLTLHLFSNLNHITTN